MGRYNCGSKAPLKKDAPRRAIGDERAVAGETGQADALPAALIRAISLVTFGVSSLSS